MKSHIKFADPPVVEVVLGVQFDPLQGFNATHAGVFWQTCLGQQWLNPKLAMPLDTAPERLDPKGIWNVLDGVRIEERRPDVRVQFTDSADERMIQVQDSWFVFNWRRRGGDYPTYQRLLPDFLEHFALFSGFAQDQGFSRPSPRNWEVTYVNRIPMGVLWSTVSDWGRVLPGILGNVAALSAGSLETFNANWTVLLPDSSGRMRTRIRHVKSLAEPAEEALEYRLVTRGPLDVGRGESVEDALTKGHDAIVQTFLETTSAEAQTNWGRA